MFENLQEKLQRAFKSLRGQARLSEENIGEALREIRLALLEADVNFKVVKELIDRLAEMGIAERFVMVGLCSSAYWSFHAAVDELPGAAGRLRLRHQQSHHLVPSCDPMYRKPKPSVERGSH